MTTDAEIQTALPALGPATSPSSPARASGIGLAAAKRLAAMGMKIVLADIGGARLDDATRAVAAIAGDDAVLAVASDVSKADDVDRLADRAFGAFGDVSLLMNNAGVGNNPGKPWENRDAWKRLLDINFWGVVHGVEAFAPRMLASAQAGPDRQHRLQARHHHAARQPCLQRLQGRREDLHRRPGACAAQRSRAPALSAHLLIPGFTYTGLTEGATEKPAGAWTGEQVVDFMLESPRPRRFLHPVPGQRGGAAAGRKAHGLGDRRHHREPPCSVALAPRLQGRLRGIHRTELIS